MYRVAWALGARNSETERATETGMTPNPTYHSMLHSSSAHRHVDSALSMYVEAFEESLLVLVLFLLILLPPPRPLSSLPIGDGLPWGFRRPVARSPQTRGAEDVLVAQSLQCQVIRAGSVTEVRSVGVQLCLRLRRTDDGGR